jgi:DNA-binding Lrp family transcriptional regulator
VLAAEVGATEAEVVGRVRGFFERGEARRLGAVFDPGRLGYRSALFGLAVPANTAAEVASRLDNHAGVTHCYLRSCAEDLNPEPMSAPGGGWMPNLWFTLSAPEQRFDTEKAALESVLAPYRVWMLPAKRRFKVEVILDPRRLHAAAPTSAAVMKTPDPVKPLSGVDAMDRAIMRYMQGHLAMEPELYAGPAAQLGIAEADLLARLRDWHAAGVLRRIALVVRHRRIGFAANGMCVWRVRDADLYERGRWLASQPEVTHCYERETIEVFPYSLYAMIHGADISRVRALFARFSRDGALGEGLLFLSVREYKKTSLHLRSE